MSVLPASRRPSAASRLFQVGCLAYGLAVAYDSARKRRIDALEAAGRDVAPEAFEPLAAQAVAPEPIAVLEPEPEIADRQLEIVSALEVEPDPDIVAARPASGARPGAGAHRLAAAAARAWPSCPRWRTSPRPPPPSSPSSPPPAADAVVFQPIDESRAGLPDGLRDSLWARAAIRLLQAVCIAYSAVLLYVVWLAKDITIASLTRDPVFGSYSFLVTCYVLARFSLAPLYRPTPDLGHRPCVSIVIPAFNEEDGIEATIDACFSADYPRDSSTSSSSTTGRATAPGSGCSPPATAIRRCSASSSRRTAASGPRWPRASAARSARHLRFVDSDSVLEPDALARLMADFGDPRVGAVVGTPTS